MTKSHEKIPELQKVNLCCINCYIMLVLMLITFSIVQVLLTDTSVTRFFPLYIVMGITGVASLIIFNLYKNSEMPRAYAEALTALASRDPRARSIAGYNPDLEKYFADFASKDKQNNGPGEYSNTYWAYLFFHQIEKPEEAAN